MIRARKNRWFNAFFARHARNRIAASFSSLRVHGLAETRALAKHQPILLVANHVSWWDPLLILHASEHLLGVDGYAMMNAANLEKLPFFALVGAFGVDLAAADDGARALRYGKKLLDRPGRALWIFAQGEERPSNQRPLGFRPGAAAIQRVAKQAACIPVALRYEHGAVEKPTAYLSFGPPLAASKDVATLVTAQEAAVVAELARIDRAVAGDRSELEATFEERPSPIGAFFERALAWMTKP